MSGKVFVTRKILTDGIDLLTQAGFLVEVSSVDRPLSKDELNEKAKKVDALITTLSDEIDHSFLERHSHLKVISNYAVGYNNIDVKTASRLKIAVGNTPDVLTEATAELTMGLMIAASRHFKAAMKNAENGEWKYFEPQGFLGHGLKNKILGIIGAGRIGKRFAQMASGAFDMQINFYNRGSDLKEFLKTIDVLSLHVPLNDQTRNMIGPDELEVMKPTAIIINTARGEVLDQEALLFALTNKRIFAAGLDVTSPEPLSPNNPLFQLPNVIILPHIASATFEARKKMSLIAGHNALLGLTRSTGFPTDGHFVNHSKFI